MTKKKSKSCTIKINEYTPEDQQDRNNDITTDIWIRINYTEKNSHLKE